MTRAALRCAIVVLLGASISAEVIGQGAESSPWPESGYEVLANMPQMRMTIGERADAAELLLEVEQELLPDGVVVHRLHQRWIVLQAKSLEALRFADIPYRADSMTVESVRGRTIRPDGTEIQATAITDFKASAPGFYSWDVRTRRIGFPSVSVGAVVEYEATLRTSPEVALPILSGQFPLRGKYRILQQAYTLTVPAGHALNWEVLGGERVVAEPSEDGRSVCLTLGEVRAGRTEEQMPCIDEVWPAIRFSSLSSWSELADRMRELLADDTPADAGVRTMADSVIAGAQTESERVERLYEFARDEIEYYVLLFGDGGYDAAPSAETLQKRRGDCKAMTVLLVAMLRHAGVEAYPALASATCTLNGAFGGFPWLPPAVNHLVTAVRTEDGEWRILDPTCSHCASSHRSQSGQTVWIIDGERGTPGMALAVPESEPAQNRVHSVVDAWLDEAGRLEVDAVMTATGDLATGYTLLLQILDQATLAMFFSENLCTGSPPESAPFVATGDVQVVSMWDPVEVRIHYSDRDYLDHMRSGGTLLPCFPEVISGPHSPLFPKPTPAREYPFAVGASLWEYDLTLHLSEGWLVNPWESRSQSMSTGLWLSYVPQSIDESQGDATYRATYAFADGVLTAHRELIVARAWIAPADYNDLDNVVYTATQDMALFFLFFAPPKP